MISWLEKQFSISHGENAPLLSMEGLRGIAVFLVFCVHYSTLINPLLSENSLAVSNFVHGFGNLGVDLFFVLSGYLIYGSVINKEKFLFFKYAIRRIKRIYPTFLVILFVYLILSVVFPEQSKIPSDSGEAFIYIIQNVLLLPGLFDIDPIITVAWSLSYELFYYILVPILVISLNLKFWSENKRILFWSILTVLIIVLCSFTGGPVRLVMFIAGIILYELIVHKEIILIKWGGLYFIIAVSIFGFRSYYQIDYFVSLSLVFILFLLMCLCAFNPASKLYAYLSFKPLRWLGNMSYSFYLIHGLTLKFCFLVIQSNITSGYVSSFIYYWLWVPLFGLSLMVSFVLFMFVEKPFSLQR